MDYFLAKELKDAGFPQNGKSCDTHSDINHSPFGEAVSTPHPLRTHGGMRSQCSRCSGVVNCLLRIILEHLGKYAR
jgi:hypothetical protein